MQHNLTGPGQTSSQSTIPFLDAEEAWFWYIRCQNLRDSGSRPDPFRTLIARPCDPDDIYRAVVGLRQKGKLHRNHLQVLASYGKKETPPDPRDWEQNWAARLWDEALDRLTTVLNQKGILLCEMEEG